MSTLRNELRKKLITLDSDFYRSITTDSDFSLDSNISYNNTPTRKLPKAFKKYKITIDDDASQQQTNNPNAGDGGSKPAENNTTTNNTGTNNTNNAGTNNKSATDKAKGFWSKFVQWFKNFWKTIWQNIQNTWNTLTANYKHLEQEANNLPNDLAVVVREQIDQANAAQTKEIQGDINITKQTILKDIKDSADEMNNTIKPIGQKVNNIDSKLGTLDISKLSAEIQKGVIAITKALGGESAKILGMLNNNYKSFSDEMKVCIDQAKQNNIQKVPTKSNSKYPELIASYKIINNAWLKLLTDIDSALSNINNDSDVTKLVQCIVNYNNTLNTEIKKPKVQEALKNRGVDIDNIIQTTQNSKIANVGEVLEFVPFYALEITFKNGVTIVPKGGVLRCVKNPQNQELYQNVELIPFSNNNQQQGGGDAQQPKKSNAQPAQANNKNKKSQPTQTGNTQPANGQSATGSAPATNTTQTS